MALDKPTTLADLWSDPDSVDELSEPERLALPGISLGMRCNIAQYRLLRHLDCSQTPGGHNILKRLLEMDETDASAEDRSPAIWLQGADLDGARIERLNFGEVYLEGANLRRAQIRGATLTKVHLEGACLRRAHLERVDAQLADLGRADLFRARLRRVSLDGANIGGASLRSARLTTVGLGGANLENADLSGAKLEDVGFSEATMAGCKLYGADLRNAALDDTKSLAAAALGGADVTNAALPEGVREFHGVEQIASAAKHARALFLAMIAACAFSSLTIWSTTDAQLLTNSATTPLPIIRASVPILGFFTVAPALLLGAYVYFHLYLQRMWETLAGLPAIFQDGQKLTERVYPWLMLGLVESRFHKLRVPRRLAPLQRLLVTLLAWWLVPVTVLYFPSRCLAVDRPFKVLWHVFVLILVASYGYVTHRIAVDTLRRREETGSTILAWGERLGPLAIPLAIAALSLLSLAIPSGLTWLKPLFPADLKNAELSIKPSDWDGSDEKLALVAGAWLMGRDLRNAEAGRAFLVNAMLMGADLRNAKLGSADLRRAWLSLADLRCTSLSGARLEGAELRGSSLCGAYLAEADLRRADLHDITWDKDTNLRWTNIYGVKNAPEGFVEWALEKGAVEIDSDDWLEQLREQSGRPRPWRR